MVGYLSVIHHLGLPPEASIIACPIGNSVIFWLTSCSSYIIVCMTFDRFYSIIKPHKAAATNTVAKARKSIVGIIIFSIFYNSPHAVLSSNDGRICIGFGKYMDKWYGQLYYWLSLIVNFLAPFVLLLVMNSFIIHAIHTRVQRRKQTMQYQSRNKDTENSKSSYQPDTDPAGSSSLRQSSSHIQRSTVFRLKSTRMKNSDRQVFIILLLVTFGFLILNTPVYVLFIYQMVVDYSATPKSYADFFLVYNVGQKLFFTNSGINFLLYVVSGGKFRTDLARMLGCCGVCTKDVSNIILQSSESEDKNSNQSMNKY